MSARTYADFGNTIPAVHDTAPGELHAEPLSLSTRRVTSMVRPAEGRPRLNKGFAGLVAFVAAEVALIAWVLA